MKSLRSWRFARIASLVAAVTLLCLGAFLSWPTTGAEVPASLTTVSSPHVDQGANGDEHPLNGGYLVVPAEEAEGSNKGPVNAGLLTALLLAFFGTSVGWLLAYERGQGVFCSSGITRRPSFVSAREDTPFLGVFRL